MTMPVGSFLEGASPYGVMDMYGNVWEWTSDWYKPYPGLNPELENGSFGEFYRVTRGSAWVSHSEYGMVVSRGLQKQEYKHRGQGFRCVKSPILK
jgi:iron(II)-dependent oxidoreductase